MKEYIIKRMGFIMEQSLNYVIYAYKIIKKELANVSAFEVDEHYKELRRDLEICRRFIMDNSENLKYYI